MDKQTAALFDLAFDPGQWFRFPKVLLKSRLDLRGLIVLAFFIDRHFQAKARAAKRGREFDSWFLASCEIMKEQLAMIRQHQDREIAKLRDKTLIFTTRKGKFTKRRFIKLNIPAIIAICTDPENYDPDDWK